MPHREIVRPRCEECFFWDKIRADYGPGKRNLGFCRRQPPKLVEGGGKWPAVHINDWCGDYRGLDANS